MKSNKNDYLDAEAIAEAVARKNMRFVPIKTDDQLDLQALHRVRDRLVHRRTAVINQIRGFLLERGITFPRGPANLRHQLPAILEDADLHLSPRMRTLLGRLWEEWKQLENEVENASQEIERIAGQDAACQRLRQIPGVGPLVSTAMVAAVGNGAAFRKGRDFAAWLGLVPRRHSTGGKTTLTHSPTHHHSSALSIGSVVRRTGIDLTIIAVPPRAICLNHYVHCREEQVFPPKV